MFRVVRDQLRVSGGWVRCGHCSEVFDAIASLIEWPDESVGRDVVAPQLRRDPPAAQATAPAAEPNALSEQFIPPLSSSSGSTAAAPAFYAEDGAHRAALSATPTGAQRPIPTSSGEERQWLPGSEPTTPGVSAGSITTAPMDVAGQPQDGKDDAALAPFTSTQSRQQVPRRWARALLWLGSATALLSLVGQWALHERDTVAAQWPVTRPWLQQFCEHVGCELKHPRAGLDDLSVESSSFSRVRGNSYRLSLTLRNKSAISVAAPSIELTLTDQQDQVIARKVLSPSQWAGSSSTIAPKEDLYGALAFSTTLERVAGYRVLAFYP